VLTSKRQLFFTILCGGVNVSWSQHAPAQAITLIQTHVAINEELHAPPIKVSMDHGDLLFAPNSRVRDFADLDHPHNQKRSEILPDGSYHPGHLGDRSNVLQFLINSIIHCEVEDIPRVKTDPVMQNFLAGALPGWPLVINVDRQKGRLVRDEVTSTCGQINWHACRVDLATRAKVVDYYLKQYMEPDCGDPLYEGLVLQLRRPEYHLSDYMQPPCQLYADVIEAGKFSSVRIFGEPPNPCAMWLKTYCKDRGIHLDFFVGRSYGEDFCEAARAKNFVLGTSTLSQNAVLFGQHAGRHLYQMLPPKCDDPFLYFGQKTDDGKLTKYFGQLCELFDTTGLILDDTDYWNMKLDMTAKMENRTLRTRAVGCESSK